MGNNNGLSAQNVQVGLRPALLASCVSHASAQHSDVANAWRHQALVACYHPKRAWLLVAGQKLRFRVTPAEAIGATELQVPCNQCIGCRMDRSRDWSTRIWHEASCHEHNSFLTLTFNDAHLPSDYSIRTEDMQKFMKRLRAKLGFRIRFFGCGEYGEQNLRPHYHLMIFGHDFPDKQPWRKTQSGHMVYRSAQLETVWTFGHAEIGTVTLESAGYVARYIVKKITGEAAKEHYERTNPETGEVHQVKPEFICMSSRPGIGRQWYDKFSGDCFPSDFVVVDGQKRPIPRYYTKQLRKASEDQYWDVKTKRGERADEHQDNNTSERLAVREEAQKLRAAHLKRELDV